MNNEVKKETNLEHYKEELKKIFITDGAHPVSVASKIVNKLDKNMSLRTCNNYYIEDILDWMAQPYEEPILDKVEKEYLSNFIKPFRNRVESIFLYNCTGGNRIYVVVRKYDSSYREVIGLPCFKKGTMYKGMKLLKSYSLEELGL